MKALTIAQFIESLAPLSTAKPGDVNGFLIGNPDREVETVVVCWSPTLSIIQECVEQGVDMIITHEVPLFYDKPISWFQSRSTECKQANLARLRYLVEGDICVYRAHTNWDVVPKYGNVDAFGTAMGWTQEIARGYLTRVYQVAPISVRQVAEEVQHKLGIPRVRVVGDVERRITRLGTAIGGVGQHYVAPEELVYLGAQAVVFGEAIEYTLYHALELDLPLIETGHMITELPGMRALAQLLQERFEESRVVFLANQDPWQLL